MNCTKNYHWILLLFLFTFSGNIAWTQSGILQQKVTIAFADLSLSESLKKLEQETDISTAFNEREINDKKINFTFNEEPLSRVLDKLLKSKNLSYKVIGNTIVIFRKEVQKINSTIEETNELKTKEKQKKYTISGYILDAESKESLIGASVYVVDKKKGTSSNEYGFYSLTLLEGNYEIIFSYIGYQSIVKQISLIENEDFSPTLSTGNQLEEVVVTAEEVTQRHLDSKMSSNKLSMEKLKSMPVLMGERDVLKMVQLMPGIQSGSEGSTGLYVRGGGPDQNLLLLDGVPIYNVNHLFGFLSSLNGDAIKSAEIIKGGFPARYGGRLSSILDVRMKEGNMEKFHGDVSVGLLSGKINLEGPIQKNKTSFHFSARRTWLDAFTTPIQKSIKQEQGFEQFVAYNFYDLNGKINHKFSEKSRLYLSAYMGNDLFKNNLKEQAYNETTDLSWGNKIFSARWNYQISPKLFSNATVYSSAYDFEFELDQISGTNTENNLKYTFSSSSKIRDLGAKLDFDFTPSPNHYVRFGVGSVDHQFTPTVNTETAILGNAAPKDVTNGDSIVKANEFTAYIEDDMSIGEKVKLNVGVHLANFNVENSNYFSVQPRAAVSFLLNKKSSLKFSYSHMTQFLHLLSSPGLGLPTDLWVPSTDKIEPEKSIQYAIGYTRSLNDGYEFTLEGYFKEMDNLLEYKSGFNIFSSSSSWEDKVVTGTGKSYGIELLLEKKSGKTTGWIGYTLSKSTRSFPDIDNGETFPYKYDRRHDISIAVTHKKSERVDFGLVWVYGSGNTYTLGTQNYNAINVGAEPLFVTGLLSTISPVNHIENRNNQRAPAYHRLDLSVNFHKMKKHGKRTWSFGLYNAYSRQNPFIVAIKQRQNSEQLFLEQTSLLPILPFASYSFKF